MADFRPLYISQQLLATLGTHLYVHHRDRVPLDDAVIVVSNHRSFMDACVLMAALQRPVRFACHHYMGEVPVMRDFVEGLGCFPLETPDRRQHAFFEQAGRLLETQQVVGIFPEGTRPMVNLKPPNSLRKFHRGFAHLALRIPVRNLAVLPVAIAARAELNSPAIPLKALHWIDPSEPLFNQSGWHPLVLYQQVTAFIGEPIWIRESDRQDYAGKGARQAVQSLTDRCHEEIGTLLQQAF